MLKKMKAKKGETFPEPAAVPAAAPRPVWSLYILQCSDGSFYTGVTPDIERRLRKHQEGTASRYTRTRRPVVLVYREECGTRSRALERECAVKAMSRRLKEALVAISGSSGAEDP